MKSKPVYLSAFCACVTAGWLALAAQSRGQAPAPAFPPAAQPVPVQPVPVPQDPAVPPAVQVQVAGPGDAETKAMDTLLAAISAQQAVMTENQTKIEVKLAAIAEHIRVARIFAARGGGGK